MARTSQTSQAKSEFPATAQLLLLPLHRHRWGKGLDEGEAVDVATLKSTGHDVHANEDIDMRTSKLAIGVLIAAVVLMSACSTQPVGRPERHPQTSYQQVVTPTGASRYVLEQGETAIRPTLDKQVAPIYPPSLARAGAMPVTVVAQLAMDKEGHVSAVHPMSDAGSNSSGALFEAAVEHAAMQWTFTPFWIQQARQDGTYLRTQKPFSLWYTFEFKMVNGKPQVEVGKR